MPLDVSVAKAYLCIVFNSSLHRVSQIILMLLDESHYI
jgi:hypothetical protein